LERCLAEAVAKAAVDRLEDVRIKGDELKITPLKAANRKRRRPWPTGCIG
jgi:hypothetical protein